MCQTNWSSDLPSRGDGTAQDAAPLFASLPDGFLLYFKSSLSLYRARSVSYSGPLGLRVVSWLYVRGVATALVVVVVVEDAQCHGLW